MKIKEIYDKLLVNEYSNKVMQNLIKKFKEENSNLSNHIISVYIKRFDEIKKSPKVTNKDIMSYSWNDLELIVDKFRKSDTKNTTVEFKNAKPIYKKNGLEVYLANTKRACVYYGTGYNFCISSRGDDNLYHYYRFNDKYDDGSYDNTIYFVFDKTKSNVKNGGKFEDPYHLLVIMIKPIDYNGDLEDREFLVTDADNEGEENMFWDELINLQPKLNGLAGLFKSVEPDNKEVKINNIRHEYNNYLYKLNNKYDGKTQFTTDYFNYSEIDMINPKYLIARLKGLFSKFVMYDKTGHKVIAQDKLKSTTKEEWFEDMVKPYMGDDEEYEDDIDMYEKNLDKFIKIEELNYSDLDKEYLNKLLNLKKEMEREIYLINNTH